MNTKRFIFNKHNRKNVNTEIGIKDAFKPWEIILDTSEKEKKRVDAVNSLCWLKDRAELLPPILLNAPSAFSGNHILQLAHMEFTVNHNF